MSIEAFLVAAAHRPILMRLANRPQGLAGALGDAALSGEETQALQALNQCQGLLLARAALAADDGNRTRSDISSLENDRPRTAEAHLTELLSRHNVLIGTRIGHHGLAQLISALAQSANGIHTLYLAGLWVDGHQTALDQYNTATDAGMPAALRERVAALDQHAQRPAAASLRRLMEVAHSQRIRLAALDCAACDVSQSLAARLGARKILAAVNHFAQLRIKTDQRDTGGQHWLACLSETRVNRFEGIAGVAESTGGIGVRLQWRQDATVAEPVHLQRDGGERVTPPGEPTYWIKTDLLMTPHPLLSRNALEEKLALPGSFLVLTRPDIGEEDYELHLHDSDHDIALTLIMRDLATRAFHVEADRPAQWPNWQRIAQQRYPSLRALRADLQSIGMRDLWPDVTPVLLSEARRLAAERPAGLLRRASPASRYQLSGAEIAWVRAHLTEFDIMERSDPGGYQNDLLLTDSERFFQRPSLPARAQPPAFAPDLPPDALFDLLLTHHPGIVIGETRLAGASDAGRTWARRILAEQLPRLSQAGVDMLFTDLLSSEPHQPLLDAWPPLADAPLPEAIRQHLAQRLPAREVEPMVALLQNAHRHGIGITALDCFLISRIAPGPLQVKVRNFYAQRCIRAHRTGNKWIALTEAGQACHFQTNTMLAGIPGVALLTGAIGLLFAGRPLSTLPDTGNWQRDAGGLRFIQADFIAAPRPPMADGAINTKLEREGDFAVVYAPDAATMAYELRYHHAGRIFVLPIRFSEEGDVELSPPSWLPIDVEYEALDAFVHELSAASGRRNVWPDVTPQPDYSLPLPQRRALLGAELAAQQMLAQFELQREAALQHLVFFSNTAIRNLFRQGKAAWQDELVLLGLTPDMPIENIKQYFALRIHQLSARQQGALLAAIADKQNQAATRVADTWVEQVLRQRVTALRRIAHNRYLAISEHQPGLCAGLVSHFAAAWQLDRRAADTSTAFNAYLDNLQAATTQPDQPMAHLLDLALLAWQFGPRERAFGTHTPLHGLSVAALLAQLTAAAAPVAFELSLGRHAMLLAKDGAPGAETYWLADPNIARCKVAGSAAIARLLEWHGQWLKTLFPSPDGERDAPLFGLRRYRDDLPEQRLFSLTETTSLLGTLTLSALCQPETLAARLPANMRQSHVFRQLQRDLSIAEYRYRLTQTGYRQMLTGRLREVLLRNQAPPSAFLVPVQIKNVVFPPRGGTLFGPRVNARVTLQTGAGVTYEIFIDGALYPTDVTFLRQVDLFRRLIAWGVPHHAEYPLEPALHIDREMLTSPLPNDEPAGEE